MLRTRKLTLSIILAASVMSAVLVLLYALTVLERLNSAAYHFETEEGETQILVATRGILSPAIGPEGIRVWRSSSFSFNFIRANLDKQAIHNPMLNGDFSSNGDIVIDWGRKTVTVSIRDKEISHANGEYDLKQYTDLQRR